MTTPHFHDNQHFFDNALPFSMLTKQNGIWYASGIVELSYPDEGYNLCFEIEETSYWFRHRNSCILSAVKAFPPSDNEFIFDVGGGNGYVTKGLIDGGFNAVLLEPGVQGAKNAQKRGVPNIICATTENANFPQNSLPAVGLFDVLEHIEDDLKFLNDIKKLLNKDGMLYLTVPAYPFLWSSEDIFAGHHRRYTLSSIKSLLQKSGFDIIFSTYFFRFLTIPIFMLRTLPYKLHLSRDKAVTQTNRDHAANKGYAGKLITSLLNSEISNISSQKQMKSGSSCLIVAKPIK